MKITKYIKAFIATRRMMDSFYRIISHRGAVEPGEFIKEITGHTDEIQRIMDDHIYEKNFDILIMWSSRR